LICNLGDQALFWALLPGDWLFNAGSAPMMPRLREIVVIGRAKWFPPGVGMDNMAWMLFGRPDLSVSTIFINTRAQIRHARGGRVDQSSASTGALIEDGV
jgi:hypothetical protein